ncbi:pyridoxal phosphate-dependent aminotransferase [Halostagnicola sp. A-GB9-2]|uniref:pyridoxal phosphate-dependent aminotransferase n=1 Tax=Halostagnicola sp. A-GB9-2 TaxID=3048066 RepID=UPI0024BFB484|nr:pyridoxal phosphate-dependent aminotransferase [Halostagnicola sp. A-GB9-2]MDJ1434210.1 pyridoxal phosphate-dependent aminotransferase [Halostagnicola sp. A-GB9-2]
MHTRTADRIDRIPQSGIREIFDQAQELDQIWDLSIGEPDFATPTPILESVTDELDEGATHYTETLGRLSLRERIADKLAEDNGIRANPLEEVIVTAGAMEALFTALTVICDPGDEVLVPAPYWPNYEGQIRSTGAALKPIETTAENDFVPQPKELEAAISSDTAVVLLNSPANPTGSVIDSETMAKLGDRIVENDLFCIMDETYEKLVYDGATHHSLASTPALFDRTVSIFSFSKSYAMTGWRVGYATGPSDIIDAMRVLQEHIVSCAAEPAQAAAEAALDQPAAAERIHDRFAERREVMVSRLDAVPGVSATAPDGAFYVFADVSERSGTSRDIVEQLLTDAHVAAVPGSVFGPGGEGYVRFSYATDAETIETAVNRISAAFERK